MVRTSEGDRAITDEDRDLIAAAVDELGHEGLRTLMIAGTTLAELPDESSLFDAVDNLAIYAVVGILDPPRPEAREAIATAHEAGIGVHMITGDHLTTASAIATDLGIEGEPLSGGALDEISDDELRARAAHFGGVLARVAPEHKIRYVEALQANGEVVAMTGDGVNDAPASSRPTSASPWVSPAPTSPRVQRR